MASKTREATDCEASGPSSEPGNSSSSPEEGDLEHIENAIKNGLVDNPFEGWQPEEVEKVAEIFAKSYRLAPDKARMELFQKAGRILWDPDTWRRLIKETKEDSEPFLSQDDIAALSREERGFWAQPKQFKITIFTQCVAAIVQGWTETVGNGANLQWPRELGLGTLATCNPSNSDAWIFATVNAAPYLAAALTGCWLSDPLSEHLLGRRAPIFASAVLIFASAIGSARSHSWQALLASRIVLGIGMGCKATVVPVFAAEVAPAHIRGTVVINWQLFVAFGIFLGFSANLAVANTGTNTWRLQTATLCLPALVLICLIYICPDSPRYQMKRSAQLRRDQFRKKWASASKWAHDVSMACLGVLKACAGRPFDEPGRVLDKDEENEIELDDAAGMAEPHLADHDYTSAFETLCQLRGSPLLAAKELLFVHVQMVIEQRHILGDVASDPIGFGHALDHTPIQPSRKLEVLLKTPSTHEIPYLQKFRHLFTIPRIRRATASAIVCMVSQQLCGVNLLAFYSSTLFSSTINCDGRSDHLYTVQNPSDLSPLWLSWSVGLTNFLFGIPSYWLIERRGRRWLLLTTTPFLALCMLVVCLGYLLRYDNDSHIPLILAFTLMFMVFYSLGMGPVPFTMSSEVYPLEHRLAGMSLGVSANLFGAGLLALFIPIITSTSLHNIGLTGIFTGLNILAFLLIAIFARETARTGNTSTKQRKKSMSLEALTGIFEMTNEDYLKTRRTRPLRHLLWPFSRAEKAIRRDKTRLEDRIY